MPDSWLDNWYPVMFTADVPADSPVAAQVFERPLVLYRDEEGSALLLLRSLRIALLLPALLAASPPLRIALLRSPPPLLLTACPGVRRRLQCLADTCPHRLAPLSEGRLAVDASGKTRLECSYHGWQFAGCGKCTKLPQLEGTKPILPLYGASAYPARARERPAPAPSSRRPSRSELASRPTRCVRRRAWPTSFSEPPSVSRPP